MFSTDYLHNFQKLVQFPQFHYSLCQIFALSGSIPIHAHLQLPPEVITLLAPLPSILIFLSHYDFLFCLK